MNDNNITNMGGRNLEYFKLPAIQKSQIVLFKEGLGEFKMYTVNFEMTTKFFKRINDMLRKEVKNVII